MSGNSVQKRQHDAFSARWSFFPRVLCRDYSVGQDEVSLLEIRTVVVCFPILVFNTQLVSSPYLVSSTELQRCLIRMCIFYNPCYTFRKLELLPLITFWVNNRETIKKMNDAKNSWFKGWTVSWKNLFLYEWIVIPPVTDLTLLF